MASVRIGSLFGIPLRLGASFLLVVPLLAYLVGSQIGTIAGALDVVLQPALEVDALDDGALPWLLGLGTALGLFASVLLHELGHSLVARRYGVGVEAITLWFLGGLSQLTELSDDWRQEFAIAVIGPIVSVVVGLACYAAVQVVPVERHALRFLLGYLAVLNVVLAGFNMLPGFPMDGGRVLRALLSRNRSRLRATQIAAAVGKGFAVLLGIVGVLLPDLFMVLIAFFVFVAASAETRQALTEAAFEGVTVERIMTPAADLDVVAPTTTLEELLDRMLDERHTGYPVVDGDELVGIVTLEDVQEVDPDRRAAATVADVATTDPVTVRPDDEATHALGVLQRADVGRLLVTDADGSLVGLLSRTDMMTVLEVVQTGRSVSLGGSRVERAT